MIDLGELGFIPDVDVHGTFGISENGLVAFGKVPDGGTDVAAHIWLPSDMFNLSEGIHDLDQVVTLDSPSIARDVNTSGMFILQTGAIRDDSADASDVPLSARAVMVDLSQSPKRVVTFDPPDTQAWSSGQAITETIAGDTYIAGNLLRPDQLYCDDSVQGPIFGSELQGFRTIVPTSGTSVTINTNDVLLPLHGPNSNERDIQARVFDVASVGGSITPIGYSTFGRAPGQENGCPTGLCPPPELHCNDDGVTWPAPGSPDLLVDPDPNVEDPARAYGTNSAGDVVGAFVPDPLPTPIAWPGGDPQGGIFIDAPGNADDNAIALAINDATPTQVVGHNASDEALLWDDALGSGVTVSRLNELIAPGYTDEQGDDYVDLQVAHDINDDGWIVVRMDSNPPFQEIHAAVLIPLGDCPSDLDNDGEVSVSDLLMLLAAWGDCPDGSICPEDIDASPLRTVGVPDLLLLLCAWGECATGIGEIPQSVQDCLDRFELGSLELEHCIEAVESQE